MKLGEHRRLSKIFTHAWDHSVLYIFRNTIERARHRAATHPEPLVHGTDVADMPCYGLSLVWLGDTPHLFSGSLTTASERGMVLKRGMVQARREDHASMRRELEGFLAQYANGIGE